MSGGLFDGLDRREAIRQALDEVEDNDGEEDSDWSPGKPEAAAFAANEPTKKRKSTTVKRGGGVAKRGRKPGGLKVRADRLLGGVAGETLDEDNADSAANAARTTIVASRTSYTSVADEYDYTKAHGPNDNSIEGLIRSRNYDKAMSKAESLALDMEEVLFTDDGIGTAPPEAVPPRPLASGDNQEIAWQVERIKQLNKRLQDLEGITFKQKDVVDRLGEVDFFLPPR